MSLTSLIALGLEEEKNSLHKRNMETVLNYVFAKLYRPCDNDLLFNSFFLLIAECQRTRLLDKGEHSEGQWIEM